MAKTDRSDEEKGHKVFPSMDKRKGERRKKKGSKSDRADANDKEGRFDGKKKGGPDGEKDFSKDDRKSKDRRVASFEHAGSDCGPGMIMIGGKCVKRMLNKKKKGKDASV